MLNIPSTVNDPNYRYRMPKMQLKTQSKGNGIKTNIVNLADVAKHLRTNPEYILKFFGFQKASQTTQKSSKVSGGSSKKQQKTNTNYIIQGSFTDDELLKTLDKFIDKYILCPKCKLPEMHLYLVGDKIQGKCDSCPFNGDVDNKHRLASLIVKKPPTYKPQAMKNAQQKIEKINTVKKQEEPVMKKEQETTKVEEKVEQKLATELFNAQDIEFGSPELQELIEYSKNFIDEKKKEDFDIASAQIVANLKPLGLKKPLIAYVLFHSFFTVNISKQVAENCKLYLQLMKKLVGANSEAETFLNIEYLFLEINKQKDFSKFIPTILMKAYDSNLFSDDYVKKWAKDQIPDLEKMFLFNQARNEKFKELAADFIAAVADDSEEEEEDQ